MNIPNMSYCAFENTYRALKQLKDMLNEALDNQEPMDLNQYEQRPYRNMSDLCAEIQELIGLHDDMVEDQERFTEQDEE